MDLNGAKRGELRKAIVSAFPNWGPLQIMVDERLGDRLQDISSQIKPMPEVAHDLIGWAISRGRLSELVIGASAENPGNPQLRAFAEQFEFAAGRGGELERMVMPLVGLENMGQWIDKLSALRRGIARYEDEIGYGTAFLVATDVVLTNHHVVREVLEGKADPKSAFVLFDYETGVGGAAPAARKCKLADAWDCGHNADLDYALVRLAVPAADDAVGGGKRGFIKLDGTHKPGKNEPIIVVQHPDAMTLKIAIGTVASVAPDDKTVSYTANTMVGSSEAPCLNSGLHLVVLHNKGGDKENHGIRLDAIFKDLKARGLDGLLG